MSAILQTVQLMKTYPNTQALRGINLSIQKGELIAVMGASGSGKSTLLHLLGALDTPSSGEVYLDGERIDILSESRRAVLRRQKIGFVFQFFNLMNNLTVADNVEMPALVAGLSPKAARQRREELLTELGIADKADQIPSQLSGGQQQRVAIARALINRPAVLLADEPTGNLDSASTLDVLDILQRTHSEGQTIFMVTHDARVASIADRIITMKDGQIKQETQLQDQDPIGLADMVHLEV